MARFNIAPSPVFAPGGAVYLARGQNLLSRGIRWAETSPGEAPSWANHVGIVTHSGYLVPPFSTTSGLAGVSESLWHIKNHVWWDKYKDSPGYAVAIYNPLYIDSEARRAAIDDALTRTGQRYGYWRLFGFLGERLTRIPFTRLFRQERRIVCSNHVGLALRAGGMRLPENPGALDPDDLLDFFVANPKSYRFLGWSVVPQKEK